MLKKYNIGICGAPSSGKTTLSAKLNIKIKEELKLNCMHIVEYATTYKQKHKHALSMVDQLLIFYGQLERERLARQVADITISDSPLFLSYIYAMLLNDNSQSNINAISIIYQKSLEYMKNYDKIIFIPFRGIVIKNNIRTQTKEECNDINDKILSFLSDHKIEFSSYYSEGHTINEMMETIRN